MQKGIQEIKKYTHLVPPLQRWIDRRGQAADLARWQKKPRTLPLPHLLKQDILKGYAIEYKLSVFLETGTYMGEMVEALRDTFKTIYSIELSPKFAQRAKSFFRYCRNVTILQGDSGDVIGELIQKIDHPTLFWLDGHWSADQTARGKKSTPIIEELSHILHATDLRHVILIDDARSFGRSEGYPTLDELKAFIFSLRKNVEILSEDDIIRILPQ
jgi:hypothetical protein